MVKVDDCLLNFGFVVRACVGEDVAVGFSFDVLDLWVNVLVLVLGSWVYS